ncbi:MAG: alanine--tRNA ligase [Cyclobacteriaceae bacterium]|nr:alanine--tRNA ligase [Cyclobacteriaceae bacterium]
MNADVIRQRFLNFFNEKGHQTVDSAPLVIKNDPTLMFTNAGMNQFKDYFLGNKIAKNKRITDTQKCLRVSGKHNDLEEVGMDTYHHTMFEMLGNWSFGDYFKKEAIAWAWELLTEEYKLPKDRMYVSVFGGDKGEKLELDQEAYDYWAKIIDKDRILHGSKKDNFWEMGETGPCGPCSEIHIDLRPDDDRKKVDGKSLVNEDHPQVVEVWNLVFMEYNRLASGVLEPLPAKHVDTGMGFERLCMAIQGKQSNYETDVFTPLINAIADKSDVKYGENEKTDIALRVISDHIRAISFAISDGQLPSNTGAGYVIRRILRRAVRYGYTFLGLKEPFLYDLVLQLANQFEDVFPELKKQHAFVSKVIKEEEISFLRTLENGLKRLDNILKSGEDFISGELTFELYDTYGFPLDLTSLIARENGLNIDEEGFKVEMQKQKNRSKADAVKETGDWIVIKEAEEVAFVGYDELTCKAQILKYRTIIEKKKEKYQLVISKTPFYAESGGQVGDVGFIENNGEKIAVVDTQKENDLIVHFVDKLPSNMEGDFNCVVNASRRVKIVNNHSATHLLHSALRQVLGEHVEQRGSLVNDKALRFDFSHFSKMTDNEIRDVERIVNAKIRENVVLTEQRNVPIDEAEKMGATALFGEKYGDFVRIITFDPAYSVELCGGTHAEATGQIGLFKIISESSIAAGVRRVEAITAETAEQFLNHQLDLLNEIKVFLKEPKDLSQAVANLVEEKNTLVREVEKGQMQQALVVKNELLSKLESINNKKVIIEKITLPSAEALKKIAFDLKNQIKNLYMVLAADINGKPQIAVVIGDDLIPTLHAGNIVRDLAKEIKGGGGGQPFFATAGGSDLTGLDKVVEKAKEFIDL